MLAMLSCEWEAVEPAKLPGAACNELLVTLSRLQIAVALACSTGKLAVAQVRQRCFFGCLGTGTEEVADELYLQTVQT